MKSVETQSKLKLMASLCIFGTISLFVRNIALGSGLIALSRGLLGTVFLLLFLVVRRQKPDIPAIRKNLGILLLSGGIMGSTGRCCLRRTGTRRLPWQRFAITCSRYS